MPISPHDFRRLLAIVATRAGERIVVEAGGWQSTEMIRPYTRALRLKT